MNELDSMLEAREDMVLPPLVRFCKRRKEGGDRIEVEIDQPDGDFGSTRRTFVIHRWDRGGIEQDPRREEWDDGVNSGLIDLGIRAINLREEGARFALGLRAALHPIERRYGDGYLNAILLDLLDESEISKAAEIADIRKEIGSRSLVRGQAYRECREQIAEFIGGRAAELRVKLGYNADEVKKAMTIALAEYLDGRFSVIRRRPLTVL